jgi:hypothetical protein
MRITAAGVETQFSHLSKYDMQEEKDRLSVNEFENE